MSNDPPKKPKGQDMSGDKLKQAFVAMQIKAMQRAAEIIQVDFGIDTLQSIKDLNHKLIELTFQRKLDARTLGAVNGVVANQIRILIPPAGVAQTVQVAAPQVTVNFDEIVKEMSSDERTVLSRVIARLEAEAQSSQS